MACSVITSSAQRREEAVRERMKGRKERKVMGEDGRKSIESILDLMVQLGGIEMGRNGRKEGREREEGQMLSLATHSCKIARLFCGRTS